MNIQSKSRLVNWVWVGCVALAFSIAVIIGLYFSLYPLLSYDRFGILLDPLKAIKVCALVSALLIPHGVNAVFPTKEKWVLFLIWVGLTAVAFLSEDGIYDGNPNIGLAGYVFGFQLLAVFGSVLFVSLRTSK